MRNKGFFWFITILLIAICIFQVSFTFVSNSVEKKAEKEANEKVADLKLKAATTGDSALLPNGVYVNFNQPEAEELAKAAFINQILIDKADVPVYPILGTTFSKTKEYSIALGLDLVGGMAVTLEISTPDLVKSFARNERDVRFKKPYDAAVREYNARGGDFISIFIAKNKEINKSRVVALFETTQTEGLGFNSTDSEVEDYLRKITASSMEGVQKILNERIKQFGIAQPNITKDQFNNRLYIELPGVQDEMTVSKKLVSMANLEFYETYFPSEIGGQWQQAIGLSRQKEIVDENMGPIEDSATMAKKAKESKSLSSFGGTQKGLSDLVKPAGEFAMGYVSAENKLSVDAILNRSDIMALFPEDVKFMWSAELEQISEKSKEKAYTLYAIRIPEDGKARVGGKDVNPDARGEIDPGTGKVIVNLSMNSDGADKWAEMTADNKDRIVAITMDNVVYSAPRVNEPITGGSTQISGNFDIEEAQGLADLLNGGALPAPCVIKEQTKVGPTIGKENSKAGLISFGFAFLAVLLYMYFYYGKAGLAANIALAVNVLFIFGALAAWNGVMVLTLAGIAGIVLTIGTAVDANILIFERIREEQARGLNIESSVDVGFKRALPSIIDANVTHLLVAIILKVFGTGEIESFASTLIIGIFTSMFSAIIISKLVFHAWMSKGKSISLSTRYSKGLFKNFQFDWVGKRKYFYIFSISVTLLGVGALFARGLKPSVEFTGGRTFVVKFENKADIEYIRTNLEKVFVENKEIASIDLKTKSTDYNVEIVTNYMLKDDNASQKVADKLKEGLEASKAKMGSYEIIESRSISASVSSELWTSSAISITLALIAIFAYILLRFGHWQYSIGAIVGLAHDAFFVISIFSLLHGFLPFSLDVNQAFIAAILTVIGYSMNDTVIVFDRIRENLRGSKEDDHHYDIINKSLNTTLSRTFNTSMILFVVVLIMFIFGGAAIKGFLFALLVGVIIGTYSSLCVATPILIDFSKRLKA